MKRKNKVRRKTTSCGGVVWRKNQDGTLSILLIKQFPDKERWGIPKGHAHTGESFEECARREIREETGVSATLGQRLIEVSTSYKDEDKTVISWLAVAEGDDTPRHDDPDNEVADARWFGVDELPEIHLYQRPLIAHAVNMLWEMQKLADASPVEPAKLND